MDQLSPESDSAESDSDKENSFSTIHHETINWNSPRKSYAKHKGYVSRRKVNALAMDNILKDVSQSCGCDRHCYDMVEPLIALKWRKKYHLLTMGIEQQQKLLELYRETLFTDGREKTLHLCETLLVCKKTWYSIIMGISESTYTRIRKVSKEGIAYLFKDNRKRKLAEKGEAALGFMKYYVDLMGDASPSGERILMPLGLSVNEIYRQYQITHERSQEEILKRSRFYEIWKAEFSHVSYPKHCKIAKCNTCMLARHLLEQNLPPEAQVAVSNERQQHLLTQQNERRAYYGRREEAMAHPEMFTSVIVDGMDQSKTNLPHFKGWISPKENDPTKMLQTHIVGVLIHGKATYACIDFNQYPHDSNLTLNCLLYSLTQQAKNKKFTPTLYVQLDNCGRENKNRFFLGCMAYLVAKGLVDEIIMSFLMVGHTHEDIDSKFSKISTTLSRKNAKTVPELLSVIESSTTALMIPTVIPCVYNIRDWIAPCLNSIHNQSYPHVYRFRRDIHNNVNVHFKNWSTDQTWLPKPEDEQLELFIVENGRQKLPQGVPEIVEPDFNRKVDVNDLRHNIEKLKNYLNFEQYTWWDNILVDQTNLTPQEEWEWHLNDIEPCSTQNVDTSNVIQEETSPLSRMMEKERSIPDVYTGKKRKPNNVDTPKVLVGTGYMVAFEEKGELYIGKVTKLTNLSVTVIMYIGTINATWQPALLGGNTLSKTVQRQIIKEDLVFYLTKSNKLPNIVKEKIKHLL